MSDSTTITRVEKHRVKKSNSYYPLLMSFCHTSKSLYNSGNYIIRQQLFEDDSFINYCNLDKMMKDDPDCVSLYRAMPTAKSAQQTLRLLDQNWRSYFAAIKDYKENPNKYKGKPKFPRYLEKDGFYQIILTNQDVKLRKNGIIEFPKSFDGFHLRPKCVKREDFISIQQVRFIPKKNRIIVEVVYNIEPEEPKEDNERYIGIDIGVNNLATVCNNAGLPAFIVNGKPLKAINQFYNKERARLKSIAKKVNKQDSTNRLDKLSEKRTNKINDYLHKASKKIIDSCIENDISKIVIGKNKGWKQEVRLGKRGNQNFVNIPFARFIDMISYKAEEVGIAVILTEESYTSGTSFLDGESPVKKDYDKSRRVKRGLFKANDGTLINADLNAAYQIVKKVFPKAFSKAGNSGRDRGCALHPVVVGV